MRCPPTVEAARTARTQALAKKPSGPGGSLGLSFDFFKGCGYFIVIDSQLLGRVPRRASFGQNVFPSGGKQLVYYLVEELVYQVLRDRGSSWAEFFAYYLVRTPPQISFQCGDQFLPGRGFCSTYGKASTKCHYCPEERDIMQHRCVRPGPRNAVLSRQRLVKRPGSLQYCQSYVHLHQELGRVGLLMRCSWYVAERGYQTSPGRQPGDRPGKETQGRGKTPQVLAPTPVGLPTFLLIETAQSISSGAIAE